MWMSALVPALWAIALVFLPGLLVTLALRLKGFDAFALAPPVSVAMISMSAIAAPMLGVSWALWVPFVLTAITALVGFLLIFLVEKNSKNKIPRGQASDLKVVFIPMTWSIKKQLWFYLATLVGALLSVRNLARSIGDANWISQTWDNVFHLNAVRYIVDHGNGSALFISSMTSGDGAVGFYPAAWHDIVSLVFMQSGASIPVATNATALVVGGVIWSVSMIFMIRCIFPMRKFALALSGALVASFISFPYSLVYFGVLYPNLLGYSLLPVGIGLVVQLFRVGTLRFLQTSQTLYLGVFTSLGIALAHPNAIMSLLVLIVPILTARLILQVVSAVKGMTRWWLALMQVLAIVGIFYLFGFLWTVIRPPESAGDMWDPNLLQGEAVGELLTNTALNTIHPLWLVTILFIIGAYFLARCRNRLYWIFASWGVLAYFYVAARSMRWDEGRYATVGVWYNDSYRLAALAPMLVIVFIAYGAQHLSTLVSNKMCTFELPGFSCRPAGKKIALVMLGTVVVLCLSLLLQSSVVLNNYITRTRNLYQPTLESGLLTPDEINVLNHLDNYVPANDEIIVSAFNGGSLAYAFADRKVNVYHTLATMTDDDWYLYHKLDKADSDPKVCQILAKRNIKYWLWFGWKEVNNKGDHAMWYPSFNKLFDTQGIISPVYSSGGAVLYKITACG